MSKKVVEKLTSRFAVLIFYDLLLIATPFLMLQTFLQTSVRKMSEAQLNLGGQEIPWMIVVALPILLPPMIYALRKDTGRRLLVLLAAAAMWIGGQQLTDYYMNHEFYHLQHNWHYIAYGIFAVMMYRYMSEKGYPDHKIIVGTFFKAMLLSLFDEGFQYFLSSRIFDLCDVAKDMWGTIIGMTIVFLGYRRSVTLSGGWKFLCPKIKGYFSQSLSALFVVMVYAVINLYFSSLITDHRYLFVAFLLPIGISFVILLMVHLLQKKAGRIFVLSSLVAILGFFVVQFSVNSDEYITSYDKGMVMYKGIPLPYFDVMFFPGGGFRFVDKKTYFTRTDMNRMMQYKPDIIIITTGFDEDGANGFHSSQYVEYPYFTYDHRRHTGVQLLIFSTAEAWREYNRMTKEGKKVLMVMHTT